MKNSKEIKAVCYAGNIETVLSTHQSVKEAKQIYNCRLQLNVAHFVNGIGYIKLIK